MTKDELIRALLEIIHTQDASDEYIVNNIYYVLDREK